jgi:hypothetical protein
MCSIQDGKEALTKEGCQQSLGLSEDGGCVGRMRNGNYCRVYPVLPPDDCSVRGNKTNLHGMYGGQGLMPRQWWWEQPMCLDASNATGSNANDAQLDAPAPADV